jgi:hypothetical protein
MMNNQKMTSKARELLSNREPHFLYGDLGLSAGEESVTHERMLEFINTYPVMDISVDNNNYGEFQFISVKAVAFMNNGSPRDELIQFWGNGYHEYRGVMMVRWNYNIGNAFLMDDKTEMNKSEVIKQIESRRAEMGIRKDSKQETSGNTFELLANLLDDDAAMIMMDELGE